MNPDEKRWVVFYSKEDEATNYSLQNAEILLRNKELTDKLGVNDLLELYNIKLYFDNDLFLPSWDEATKSSFKTTIEKAWTIIKQFWLSITSETIPDYVDSLNGNYKESFWDLVNFLQVYKRIDKRVFGTLLEKHPYHIYYILNLKQIVNHFGQEVRSFLVGYHKSAEILLSQLEIKHTHNPPKYHFPACLSIKDKEEIISNYIDQDNPNLNYIRVIEHSKDSDSFKLSPKVRLSAKKKSAILNEQLFKEGAAIDLSAELSLNLDQDEPRVITRDNGQQNISYSVKYINKQDTNISLFYLFETLFLYTNRYGVINLISKESEMDSFEKSLLKSKNEYANGIYFEQKNRIAQTQIYLFDHYLREKNKSIETLIESFVNESINVSYDIKNLCLKFPTEQSTYLEKIRILAPELDSLLKQYQTYVTEGQIDFELISLDSTPLRFSEIQSLVEKKYVYIQSDEVNVLKHYFFSDQSSLFYVKPHKNKYNNLYDLLTKENVLLNNFENYQLRVINHFITNGYLSISADDVVVIEKDVLLYIVRELHYDEVISYRHYPLFVRKEIDKMVDDGLLRFESTLFTKPEISYFNYYLNKKEFTNGLDLRNKYLHGTNNTSVAINKFEYYTLIRLLILIILKIDDDLLIHKHKKQVTQ
ncbi:hypothetical protein [Spirosoma sp. KNUC1025]|uniref:hypothetical protein n=1 Tax=Spirosoma sp. KNUC1025 TaxID=2894082 RepID=UPI00386FAE74|nr:hypothetical protein LN737_00645 [Spirosoma sp. KNUC1025]